MLTRRLRKGQREKAIIEAEDATQTLMDYCTPHLKETNNIQLPTLPQGVTFEFKHGFLQMIESNMFNEASHEDPTTKNYTFNIARLTSVFEKTDVNTNAIAYL